MRSAPRVSAATLLLVLLACGFLSASFIRLDWLGQDVKWIITDEEAKAFKSLQNDEERDNFIEAFWDRRDPTPDTIENEFKEEHYRRILYANDQFGEDYPGWMTDRGRIYIAYGPPDEQEMHATELDSSGTSQPPSETWRYQSLEGIGQNVVLKFADLCPCGHYKLDVDPKLKDILLKVPPGPKDPGLHRLNRLTVHPRFQDLEEALQNGVVHRIPVNLLPYSVRTDFVKATDMTTVVAITVQVAHRDLRFVDLPEMHRANLRVFGRVTSLTGHVVEIFETPLQVDVALGAEAAAKAGFTTYQFVVPLRAGLYRLDIVVKDDNADRVGNWSSRLEAPQLVSSEGVATSSLVLANQMGLNSDAASAALNIGKTYLRPRAGPPNGGLPVFKQTEEVDTWMQVYSLAIDKDTWKPSATFRYELSTDVPNVVVTRWQESTAHSHASTGQVTLKKTFPAGSLAPGTYTLKVNINDALAKKTLERYSRFIVE